MEIQFFNGYCGGLFYLLAYLTYKFSTLVISFTFVGEISAPRLSD